MKMILAESACALVHLRRREKAVMGRDEGREEGCLSRSWK